MTPPADLSAIFQTALKLFEYVQEMKDRPMNQSRFDDLEHGQVFTYRCGTGVRTAVCVVLPDSACHLNDGRRFLHKRYILDIRAHALWVPSHNMEVWRNDPEPQPAVPGQYMWGAWAP